MTAVDRANIQRTLRHELLSRRPLPYGERVGRDARVSVAAAIGRASKFPNTGLVWGLAVCTPSHVREPHPTLPAAYPKPSAEDVEADGAVGVENVLEVLMSCVEFVVTNNRLSAFSTLAAEKDSLSSR